MEEDTKANPQLKIKLKQYQELLKRKIKGGKKTFEKCQKHLLDCQSGEKEFHLATLLQANQHEKPVHHKLTLTDWNTGESVLFTLDPKLKLHEEVAKRFKKARKLKKGLPFAEKELEKAEANLINLNAAKESFALIKTEGDLERFLSDFPLKEPQRPVPKGKDAPPKKPYIEKILSSGDRLWIGKSAAANDLLTFQHAHGNDFWLHIATGPGSHVVIHRPKEPLDPETLQEALKAALLHSKARMNKSGEIVMTRVKHVKKIGKKQGLVQIANSKVLKVDL